MTRERTLSDTRPTRREFLQSVGVTFVVGATGIVGACSLETGDDGRPLTSAPDAAVSPNAWVSLAADGTITIQYGGTEMGQGSMTSVPLVLAEELDADWDDVRVETVAKHDPVYGNPARARDLGYPILYTAGSTTVRGYFTPMRQAGAQARKFLLDSAAEQWGVPVAELSTEPSRVVHAASGRSLSYGEIVARADVPDTLPDVDESDFKSHDEFRYLGKDITRLDVPAKTNGSAEYGIDVQVPGMVYASILRTPVEGESPVAVDDAAARAIDGVTDIVTLPYGVAVVGETVEATIWGKAALAVTWSESSRFRATDHVRDLDEYEARARDLAFHTDNPLWQEKGDVDTAFASADRVIEATYRTDPAYHAQMEPMNATASVSEDGKSAEIWVSTQTQSLTVLGSAEALETTPDRISMHPLYIGGGYGRRCEYRQKYVDDALYVSRAVGKPVKVIWSREDDVKDGAFRPLAAQYLRAALDADGNITALEQRVATPTVLGYMNEPRWAHAQGRDGIAMNGAQTTRYSVPNVRAEHVIVDRCSRLAPWRGVATSYTRFANESFIDELAQTLGADPLEFRIDLARDNPEGRAVLEEVGRMANWAEPRDGRWLGVALSDYGGTSVSAGVAEISVNETTGAIRVHRFWMAIDAGFILSPRNTEAQMEGTIIYGLSNALKERITVNGGIVEQSNFYDYQVMRMNEVPEIEVRALTNTRPPSGIGELGLATTGAAVANALFAATGVRIRELPMTPDRVLAALRA
jgi:isoquinoline 1-oxidoreductase beta subunit